MRSKPDEKNIIKSLNRTIIGLKFHAPVCFTSLSELFESNYYRIEIFQPVAILCIAIFKFESNYYRIEIYDGNYHCIGESCLNRTIIGLKYMQGTRLL